MAHETKYVIEDGKEYKVNIVIFSGGRYVSIHWFLNGKPHREKGPSDYRDFYMAWCQNWLLHCLDGPATIWQDGGKLWYINGIFVTEQAHTKVRMVLAFGLDKI
jgi:hypothetical protein